MIHVSGLLPKIKSYTIVYRVVIMLKRGTWPLGEYIIIIIRAYRGT